MIFTNLINFPPVNWSQEGWQPVLIDLTVSVQEDDHNTLGLLGTSGPRADEPLPLCVSDQPHHPTEDSQVVLESL